VLVRKHHCKRFNFFCHFHLISSMSRPLNLPGNLY
jgi:hypothetical protein